MSHFDAYRDSFPNAQLTRSKTGVLEVALHTKGGTLAFNGYTHEQFVDLFHAIASDRDNRVVILTGSGNAPQQSCYIWFSIMRLPTGNGRRASGSRRKRSSPLCSKSASCSHDGKTPRTQKFRQFRKGSQASTTVELRHATALWVKASPHTRATT